MKPLCGVDRNGTSRLPPQWRYPPGRGHMDNINPDQYSDPLSVNDQCGLTSEEAKNTNSNMKRGRRPRQRCGSHGARDNYHDSNLDEWLAKETKTPLDNYTMNDTHHLRIRTRSSTDAGGYGGGLQEKRLPFWPDMQAGSCPQQGHRRFISCSAEPPQESSSPFQCHSIQPLSPNDGYIFMTPRSGQGQSRERNQRISYVLPSPAIENALMFR